jgi:hypothetical protein
VGRRAEAPAGAEPRHTVVVEVSGKRLEVSLPDRIAAPRRRSVAPAAPPSRRSHAPSAVAGASGDAVKSPMQATVVKVAVEEGQQVVKGDLVVVLEAMKMEQPCRRTRTASSAPSTPTRARPCRPGTSCSRSPEHASGPLTSDPGAGAACLLALTLAGCSTGPSDADRAAWTAWSTAIVGTTRTRPRAP